MRSTNPTCNQSNDLNNNHRTSQTRNEDDTATDSQVVPRSNADATISELFRQIMPPIILPSTNNDSQAEQMSAVAEALRIIRDPDFGKGLPKSRSNQHDFLPRQ